jgi:NAD(P)-dependent dehydrogenase (short-subunit alcohol dehydrogenase family)
MLQVIDRPDADPAKGIVFPPRMGEPEEFARLVESIVLNPYLNGENIRLDGALRLGPT